MKQGPSTAEITASLLARLDAAGAAGLTEAKVLGGGAAKRRPHAEALERLQRGGLAVMHRKGKSTLWFAARHAPSVETVVVTLRDRAVPQWGIVWTVADLAKLLSPSQRGILPDALSALEKSSEVRELRAAKGRGRFWVFPRALQIGSQHLPRHKRADEPDTAVRAAYAAWRKHSSGSSLMAIADLQVASGVPLAELHAWLRDEAAAGWAELSEGDWSLASEAVRAAALVLHGQKFIRVRLQERG